MSHSVYDNSPFDLNHDGHINAGEASFINDTFHENDDGGTTSVYGNNSNKNYKKAGKNSMVKSILMVLSIIIVPMAIIMAVRFYNKYSAQKLDAEFDLAREEYKNTVEEPALYNNVNDLIKSVEVICKFEDERFSQYTDYQNNVEYIAVYMDDSIEEQGEEDKCKLFSSIIYDIREITQKTFNESVYQKLFDDRKTGFSMDYKDREIEIYHKCELWNFCFITSDKKYLIETDMYKTYDGRYILSDYNIAEDKTELFLFSYDYQYGTISDFENKADYDAKEKKSKGLKQYYSIHEQVQPLQIVHDIHCVHY